MHNIKDIRREYQLMELDEKSISQDPVFQFVKWIEEAVASDLLNPTAMVLSTVSSEGKPSSRVVLLKDVSAKGLDFFTNYESRKGHELSENGHVSLLFFWHELERQVRIEGDTMRLDTAESDQYFAVRPYESQIGAWASPQSSIIPNRKTLVDWYKEFEEIFKNKQSKRPPHWGGFRVVPNKFEFWQGRENRLHDRIEYIQEGNSWIHHRLAP